MWMILLECTILIIFVWHLSDLTWYVYLGPYFSSNRSWRFPLSNNERSRVWESMAKNWSKKKASSNRKMSGRVQNPEVWVSWGRVTLQTFFLLDQLTSSNPEKRVVNGALLCSSVAWGSPVVPWQSLKAWLSHLECQARFYTRTHTHTHSAIASITLS